MKILATDEDILDRAHRRAESRRLEAEPAEPEDEGPSVASGIEEAGSALTLPSSRILALVAQPMMSAPVRARPAAHGVQPGSSSAKSGGNPISASQPPPHCQAPVIGVEKYP